MTSDNTLITHRQPTGKGDTSATRNCSNSTRKLQNSTNVFSLQTKNHSQRNCTKSGSFAVSKLRYNRLLHDIVVLHILFNPVYFVWGGLNELNKL